MPEANEPDGPAPEKRLQALTTQHVRRAMGGDEASVAWVVERFTPLLTAQASYRLGRQLSNVVDPEDVVNDVWLRVLPQLGGLVTSSDRFTPALFAYLGKAVLNRTNSLLTRHLQSAPALAQDPEALDDLTGSLSGVITRAVRSEERRMVREQIERMSERDREILVLRGAEQRSNGEVASLLELSADAVAQRYSRALKRLREHFPGSVFDEL